MTTIIKLARFLPGPAQKVLIELILMHAMIKAMHRQTKLEA